MIQRQDLFDSKVQSIVEYAQINDAKINQSTCEVSGVSEVSIVCSEHEVPMEDQLPIQNPMVVQSVQFEGSNSLWNGSSLLMFQSIYSSEKLLNGTCSTVLLEPVSMVLNVMPFLHTAAINSAHISISADKRIKADGISNVVVTMFPNVVLQTVVWCFGRHAHKLRGGGSLANKKCHHASVINFRSSKVNPSVTVHHLQEQCSVSGFKAQEINEIRGSVWAG